MKLHHNLSCVFPFWSHFALKEWEEGKIKVIMFLHILDGVWNGWKGEVEQEEQRETMKVNTWQMEGTMEKEDRLKKYEC